MLKMLMDPMGGIVMTNDGNAILREITVQHPAAKTMIEIARTQDEEVGDGTTSVIVLAAEMLGVSHQFLEEKMHPTVVIQAYRQALEDAAVILRDNVATKIDLDDAVAVRKVIQSCVGTKFIAKWSDLACDIAMDAVKTVTMAVGEKKEIDIKRYAKVEKIPGGTIEDSSVLKGVMFNKDVTHPKMKRKIENPRILLLDCNLEYKKGESQTNIEIMKEEDFSKILEQEEAYIKKICDEITAFKPDLVITEKGVSDLAQHFFNKAGITAIRRLRKSDNLRVARACGATIVNRTDEITEEDIGTGAGLFEVRKIGDEYFTFIEQCKDPRACIGAWGRCHRDGSGSPAHSKGKDLKRCCPMAIQSCCLRSRGDPKNSCTKLWRQHHPHPHCLESQARQGGGEERELGNQRRDGRTGGHVCSWHLGTALCQTSGVQDCHRDSHPAPADRRHCLWKQEEGRCGSTRTCC